VSNATDVVREQVAEVDWLTVTVKDKTKQGLLAEEVNRLMGVRKDQGYTQKQWSFRGYDGWICGSIRWGTRNDGSIVMLSGEDAELNWPVVLSWCDNCTRVDLAVTVEMLEPRPNVAKDAYDVLTLGGSATGIQPRKLSFVQNNEGGQTFYLGSRASDQFGRLYDKGVESGEDVGIPVGLIWRYEVEFKQYRAGRIAKQMFEAAKESAGYHAQIGETVYKWFLSRGVSPIFSAYDNLPFSTQVYAKVSDDDITLRWLSTQVRPSIERLSRNGKGGEVRQALGLMDD
jgi:DNA relaxase NicK